MIKAAELVAAHVAQAAGGEKASPGRRKVLTIGEQDPDLAPAASYARAPEASDTQSTAGRPPVIQRNAR
jgi:hypothetical protein